MPSLRSFLRASRLIDLVRGLVVISGITTNYTRYAEDGVYAATVLTIGYDTPWRQVDAMLKEAASRTHGLRADRPPVVLQTNLSDFYVEYTCLVCLAHPAQKPAVLNTLHANIQDVFNEHGVQIMSPHYEADPGQPKVVPPEQWHAAPAPPEGAMSRAPAEARPPVGAAWPSIGAEARVPGE